MPKQDNVTAGTDDARYRLLVEAVTDYAIYMLDLDGIVASWNPGAERFKGYTAKEIIGQHFSRFYTDEDRANELPAEALRAAREDGRFIGEGWRVRKDGSRFWAAVVIDPIRTPKGVLVGYAKITRDLSERKEAEEQLRRSEEQFRMLVQGVTDYAIYMLDPAGHVTNWNVGAERIKGYTAEEIVGSHFSRFYADEDRAAGLPEQGLRTAAEKGRWETEGVRVRKDGSRFDAHVIIDSLRAPSGELIGYAKITRDITEKNAAQRALEQTREALFQAQKVEAIGKLTGGVAHDFNNLLMAILSSLELMKRRLPEDARFKMLHGNAAEAAQRGVAITQRMLAFARRQDLKVDAVEVSSVLHSVTPLLESSLGPSIYLDVKLPYLLPLVKADANQLETSILNLVVNARDAMPQGGSIAISARRDKVKDGEASLRKPGDYVVIAVTDTGEGMNEATRQRATEPFFTTKGVGKGTGLGLSMVQGMAEQLGGSLLIKSAVGRGTTVEIWLPQAAEASVKKVPETAEGAEDVSAVPQKIILVVDDDRLVRVNTAAMLEEMGLVTLEAASGREALQVLRRSPDVALVLTDHVMPHMTGGELAEQLRSERPDLPVIIATGYASQLGPAKGLVPRLKKPFSMKELEQAVSAYLQDGERSRG
jgi:PAS domain S-box-containing protein